MSEKRRMDEEKGERELWGGGGGGGEERGWWESASPFFCDPLRYFCSFTAVDRASSSSLGDAREVRVFAHFVYLSTSRFVSYSLPHTHAQALLNIMIDATKMYRSNFASSMQASQLTLPATLRLLPLFMISLLKNVSWRTQ